MITFSSLLVALFHLSSVKRFFFFACVKFVAVMIATININSDL